MCAIHALHILLGVQLVSSTFHVGRFATSIKMGQFVHIELEPMYWNGPIYLNRIGYVRSYCEMQLLDCIKTEIHRNLIIVNEPACSVGIMGLINCMELEYRRIH